MHTKSRLHYGWVVAGATFVALLGAAGMRGVLTVYVVPLEHELGWSRAALANVGAASIFAYGVTQPFSGGLCDRFGPRAVIALAIVLCGLGALAMSAVSNIWLFALVSVGLVATGAGAASMTAGTSVAARWFTDRRALVVSIAGAGVSAGQLVLIPLAGWLTVEYGWRTANVVLGVLLLGLILPLSIWLIRSDPADVGLRPHGDDGQAKSAAGVAADARVTSIREAVRSRGFWMLAGSFAICGYTSVGVVGFHLIPHAIGEGFSPTQATWAYGLMGAMNIVGTMASGWFCDRLGHRRPLAFFYFFRGLSLLILLWLPNMAVLDLWAVLFGLNYIATVPPTAAMTANLFGRRSVGAIFGWVSFAHQVGGALGAWIGGFTYDLFGSYSFTWLSAAVLAAVAAAMALLVPSAAAGVTADQATPGSKAPAGATAQPAAG